MKIGGKYNWKGQPERLIYLGNNWSGNGYWHQFAKVESPGVVWCEVLGPDLHMIEETAPDCDRSACGDYSPGNCDNPDCDALKTPNAEVTGA